MDVKSKVLDFLYEWCRNNKLAYIKKGMVEDLEYFISSILSDREITKTARKMEATRENENAKEVE